MAALTGPGLADACQADIHHPGEPDPVLPHRPPVNENGSLRAEYRCPCGRMWTCWWDARAAGWPVNRTEQAV
jgi:hypothetical protein